MIAFPNQARNNKTLFFQLFGMQEIKFTFMDESCIEM